jgi:hypothetical protein
MSKYDEFAKLLVLKTQGSLGYVKKHNDNRYYEEIVFRFVSIEGRKKIQKKYLN